MVGGGSSVAGGSLKAGATESSNSTISSGLTDGAGLLEGPAVGEDDSDGDADRLGELLGTEDGIELPEGAAAGSPFCCIALESGAIASPAVLRRRKFPVE
jgi:hypothetical protein